MRQLMSQQMFTLRSSNIELPRVEVDIQTVRKRPFSQCLIYNFGLPNLYLLISFLLMPSSFYIH